MKKLVLSIMVAVATVMGVQARSYAVDTLRLNDTHRALIAEKDNPAKQRAFFDAFPADWFEFADTYRYEAPLGSATGNQNPMGKRERSQIELLASAMNSIPDSLYCPKVIKIGANLMPGSNDDFRKLLWQALKDRPEGMLTVLEEMQPGDCLRFWMYYFGDIDHSKDVYAEYKTIAELLGTNYPDMFETAKTAFVYAWGGSDGNRIVWPNKYDPDYDAGHDIVWSEDNVTDRDDRCSCMIYRDNLITQMKRDGFRCDKPWLKITDK